MAKSYKLNIDVLTDLLSWAEGMDAKSTQADARMAAIEAKLDDIASLLTDIKNSNQALLNANVSVGL